MRRTICTAVLSLFFCAGAASQTFRVDTLAKSGSLSNRINLVFLGDGYTESQLGGFRTDAQAFADALFRETPFKEYRNYFSLFTISVPSAESGVNHPQNSPDPDCKGVPVMTANNYFGSAFDFGGIHRLLVPSQSKVFTVLGANFPLYDQAFVIANTPYYGGSGGAIAAASLNTSASEVAIHEIGHSFAFLADEYWAGSVYAAEKPNMTRESNPAKVKWKDWVNTNGVGIYPYDENPSWFRPHQNCKMRYLNQPFCSVCREAFVDRIHSLINPIDSYTPSSQQPISAGKDAVTFALTMVHPEPNTLKIVWQNHGLPAGHNVETITLSEAAFAEGNSSVTADVTDTTALLRTDGHSVSHVYKVEWKIKKNSVTGLDGDPLISHLQLDVYPNPVTDKTIVAYSLSRDAGVQLTITNMLGESSEVMANSRQPAGKYELHLTASDLRMQHSGIYILRLTVDGTVITQKLVH